MPRTDLRAATGTRVLAAADRLFLERGFAATTVRDIAAECGVSVGTVMSVGDKEGLLVWVFDQRIAELQDRRPADPIPAASADADADAGAGAGAGAGAERILDLVRPIVTLYTGHADLARTYASILVSARHSSILVTDLAAQLIEEIAEVLAHDSPRRNADDLALATALYHAFVGVLFSWAARADAPLQLLPETLRSTFAILLETREPRC